MNSDFRPKNKTKKIPFGEILNGAKMRRYCYSRTSEPLWPSSRRFGVSVLPKSSVQIKPTTTIQQICAFKLFDNEFDSPDSITVSIMISNQPKIAEKKARDISAVFGTLLTVVLFCALKTILQLSAQ